MGKLFLQPFLFASLLCALSVSYGQGTDVENQWVIQHELTRIKIIETAISVSQDSNGITTTTTYTRNNDGSDKRWHRNGVPLEDTGPGEPLHGNISSSWDASGYFEFTYHWSGPAQPPSKVGFALYSKAESSYDNSNTLFNGTVGNGVVSNGFSDPPEAIFEQGLCTDTVVSEGKHFLEVDSTNGIAVLRTPFMRAQAHSSASNTSVYAGSWAVLVAHPVVDGRLISIGLYPNYESSLNGLVHTWTIPNLVVSGSRQFEYNIRERKPSTPEPFSTGRRFKQKFQYGVPVRISDPQPSGHPNFELTLTAAATQFGYTGMPDSYHISMPQLGSPVESGEIPPDSSPLYPWGVWAKDILSVSRDSEGSITTLELLGNSSNNVVSGLLRYQWNDDVVGVAEAEINLRRKLHPDTSFPTWIEQGDKFLNAIGWQNGNTWSVTTESLAVFNWIEASGSVLEVVAGTNPYTSALALILGVVGNVGQASDTEPTTFYRVGHELKEWPDPAVCNGISWQDLYASDDNGRPSGQFSWLVQGKPVYTRTAMVFMLFDEQGFNSQRQFISNQRSNLLGGEVRTVEWYNGFPTPPPAWWMEQ